mmetsp:Transcript_63205/g.124141  ORF Transcript_63205/g.124141 Transcript_63205/m.124141 type:complete len:213 (+) Transcript_63205:232-870(+)
MVVTSQTSFSFIHSAGARAQAKTAVLCDALLLYRCRRAVVSEELFQISHHLLNARKLRVVVSSGVVLGLGKVEHLDGAFLHVRRKTLAPAGSEFLARARVRHGHAQRFREIAVSVSHKGDDALAVDALRCGPSVHDRRIVHAEDDHFVDPFLSQVHLGFFVARDLACGSGWGERTRKTDEDNLFVKTACLQRDIARVSELEIKSDVRDWRPD